QRSFWNAWLQTPKFHFHRLWHCYRQRYGSLSGPGRCSTARCPKMKPTGFWPKSSPMNPELESLIKAFDAAIQAQGRESERLEAIYESLLAEAAERHPNVSTETLDQTVQLAHSRWIKAQAKFPTLPPQA